MLRVFGGSAQDCDGMTRRSFVQAGALGLGGLGLTDLLRLRASASTSGGASTADPRSVILFWLSGGPGHMETWTPSKTLPADFGVPSERSGRAFPASISASRCPSKRGAWTSRRTYVRSTTAPEITPRATHWMLTGYEGPAFNAPDNTVQRRPAMGSAVARLRTARRPGMPPYIAVPHLRGGTDNLFHYAAYLGGAANPFVVDSDPNGPNYRVKNLTPPAELSLNRLADRRKVLEVMDGLRRASDPKLQDLDSYYQRAFEMLTGKSVAAAFDINAEDPRLRDRYGRHTFGQSALLARRLVEAGTPFVTVNCVPWDHHGTKPQLTTEDGAKKLIPPLDRAIAALIDDLIARGMYDSTLVVAMGEFGRTPRMNKDAGRDHWGNAFSVLMGCGSMKMGQVIGRSSAKGEHVVDRPISPEDVAATIYHHLGIDGRSVTFEDRAGRPTYLIERGAPIRELVG